MKKFVCEPCESTDNHDFLLKCIIVGESGVGKTSLLYRMTKQDFIVNQSPTIGIDFGSMYTKIQINDDVTSKISDDIELEDSQRCLGTKSDASADKIIKVQIWDCAGQVRFRSLVQSYFRQAQVVFFVYDVNDVESFQHLETWINTFNEQVGKDNYISCVIGNKCDLASKTDILEVETFCKEMNMKYYFMSAKTDTFESITRPLTNCIEEAFERHLKGSMKLDVPYWNQETVDLKRKRKKKSTAEEETNTCLVCTLQ